MACIVNTHQQKQQQQNAEGIDWDKIIKEKLHDVITWPSNAIAPAVLFVCGYRRTGKDTFANDVIRGSFSHDWAVFAPPKTAYTLIAERGHWICELKENCKCHSSGQFGAFMNAKKVAFADGIRRVVCSTFQLGDDFDYEKNKDSMIVNNMTIRQHLIDAGSAGRNMDKNYWVKDALAPLFSSSDTTTGGKTNNTEFAVCSDWRFVNEVDMCTQQEIGVKGVTVRLYRPDIPVPAYTIASEHDLDNTKTDYLLVPKYGDFLEAVHCFGEIYKDYMFIGEIFAANKNQ